MQETFRTKLKQGDLLIGTIITLPSPEIAEIYSQAGFDWLFIDLEHGALIIKNAQVITQSLKSPTAPVIRVPTLDETWIKKALDIGISGIIIPQVNTAEEAELAIRLCKYPPEGARSVGISRAHGYGARFKEYVESANEEIAVIIQVEHIDAVNNIEEILKVPGIDCVFIGPYDLSASMGKMGQVNDSEVQAAIQRVASQAKQHKIPLGIFGANAGSVKPFIENGYSLIAVGIDTMLLYQTAKEITSELK